MACAKCHETFKSYMNMTEILGKVAASIFECCMAPKSHIPEDQVVCKNELKYGSSHGGGLNYAGFQN